LNISAFEEDNPAKMAPGATKAPLRYVVSKRQRPSEYEEVTLHSQWSPHNFAKQGWFNFGADGRSPWDDRSTRLRCATVAKPPSWWYDASRAGQPAAPLARDNQIEQVGRQSQDGWWGYRDPAQMWFRPYVEMQAGQENMLELATNGAAQLELYRSVSHEWLKFLQRHFAAWRHVEYGLFMALCYAQREALSDVVATPFLFQAVDKERHAQDIALHCMALEQMIEGFSDAGAIDAWMDDPVLQPVRRYVEFLLASRDWGEILFAVNLVFEPVVARLMTNYLVARQATACGDPVTPLIAQTAEADRQRAIAATAELSRYVIANEPANKATIEEWVAHWTPQAIAAAENLRSLAVYPSPDPEGFTRELEKVKADHRALLVGAGLDVAGVAA
jgi:methane monooxygenase component A beta chain/propane monooxygenase small subunit